MSREEKDTQMFDLFFFFFLFFSIYLNKLQVVTNCKPYSVYLSFFFQLQGANVQCNLYFPVPQSTFIRLDQIWIWTCLMHDLWKLNVTSRLVDNGRIMMTWSSLCLGRSPWQCPTSPPKQPYSCYKKKLKALYKISTQNKPHPIILPVVLVACLWVHIAQ